MEECIIGGGGRRAKGAQTNKYGALYDVNKKIRGKLKKGCFCCPSGYYYPYM